MEVLVDNEELLMRNNVMNHLNAVTFQAAEIQKAL
jgi:hypothetical protein